jgi:hypothetical protein
MAKKKHKLGVAEMELTDGLTVSDEAQKLTPEAKKKLPKPWKTHGSVARDTIAAVKAHPGKLRLAPGQDAASLQRLVDQAEGWNPIVTDLRALLALAENANALADAALHSELLAYRRQLNAQIKEDPELAALFAALLGYGKS